MRWGRAVVIAAVTWAGAAWGQALTSAQVEVRAAINELSALARDGKYKMVVDAAASIKKRTESARDFHALEVLYHLMSVAADELGDKQLTQTTEIQNAILRVRVHGADDALTVKADVNVALTSGLNNLNRRVQIAATNALSSIALLRNQGEGSSELDEREAVAHTLLADNYERTQRPELALYHYRLARERGGGGHLPASNMAGIEKSIVALTAIVETARSPHQPGSCKDAKALETERRNACLKRAHLARLDNDAVLAEQILRELIIGAQPNNLGVERLPAAFDLHLLLVTNRAPDDREVVNSVLRLGNRLAIDDFLPAALLTMRTAATVLSNGVSNKDIADLCGHIARRAARGGDEDLALRFLDMQLATLDKGRKAAGDAPDAVDLAIEQTLVLLEAASFAELNSYEGLAVAYRTQAEDRLNALPQMDLFYDLIMDKLAPYQRAERGFVYPGPGAAAEMAGRMALRAPRNALGRSTALQSWISSEWSFRGNKAGALTLSERLIGEQREGAEPKAWLAGLLKLRASLHDDPLETMKSLREAYEIWRLREREVLDDPALVKLVQNEQVSVLLALARLSASTGDAQTQHSLIEEARNIAEKNPTIDLSHHVGLALFAVQVALEANDLFAAIVAGEAALSRAVTGSRVGAAERIAPARRLADLYARADRLEDARVLYRDHVTPASDALRAGESSVLENSLGFTILEAYFAPTPKTLEEITNIALQSTRTARRDEGLSQSIVRTEAFARYGLGQGVASLAAGRRAMSMTRSFNSEKVTEKEDRYLLETIVGAAVMAAAQVEQEAAPR